jgi:hypothetical protein
MKAASSMSVTASYSRSGSPLPSEVHSSLPSRRWLDHVAAREVAFELEHVLRRGAAEGVDRLIVVADREHRVVGARQQLEPPVLQAVGILELVHQDVREAPLVVGAQHFVAREQLEAAQQQLGEIDRALAVALRVVLRVDLDEAARILVQRLDLRCAQALVLVGVDEVLHLARRVLLVVHAERLHHALEQRQLVLGVQDLEGLRQSRVAMVRAQQPVAQAVEGAHPHPARVDRQHGRDAGEHLARRLVGERDGEQGVRADLSGLDEPGDARGQHARLAAAGAREDQRRLVRQGDGSALLRVEAF